jgi:ABC-type transport system substrate-binding protein
MESRRLRILLAALALGSAFQVVGMERTALGSADHVEQQGGIFRISLHTSSGIDYMDPALASSPPGWALLDTTCARLMAYPDKAPPAGFRLQPEVAAGAPAVSDGGKTYTFRLRNGFRFSDGTPVRATAFARAINRVLAPHMNSPGVQYVRDIVGAGRVLAGKATSATGVVVRGNTLVVRLTRPAPDFPHRTASTFLCAVPPSLPIDAEGVGAYPAAGPYYVVDYRRGERVVIRRNRFYGGSRPHHVDGYDVDLRAASPQEMLQRVDRGDADWGHTIAGIYFDPALGLVEKYGLNRSRLFLRPGLTLRMIAFNSSRPLFRDNAPLRRAVNFALNRRALTSTGGQNASRPSDQYLPAIMPGFRDADVYPFTADVATARRLIGGQRKTAVLYTLSLPPGPQFAAIVKANLGRIGIAVEIKTFPLGEYVRRLGTKGEPFDMAFVLQSADTPDPGMFLGTLFSGKRVYGTKTILDAPAYARRFAAAARLGGSQRYLAFGDLDVDLARNAAPLAALGTETRHDFFSARMGCQIYNPVYGMSLAALCIRRSK